VETEDNVNMPPLTGDAMRRDFTVKTTNFSGFKQTLFETFGTMLVVNK